MAVSNRKLHIESPIRGGSYLDVIRELQGLASHAQSAEARASFTVLATLFRALDMKHSTLASWDRPDPETAAAAFEWGCKRRSGR